MTTVHDYEVLPPVSPSETYLELDQLSTGSLYEVQSDHFERIAYFAGGGWFYGLHVEDRPGAFSLRLGSDEGHTIKNGTGSGVQPLYELVPAADLPIDETDLRRSLLGLLVTYTARYYQDLAQGITPTPLSPNIIAHKSALFSQIATALEEGALSIGEHAHIDLSSLRES